MRNFRWDIGVELTGIHHHKNTLYSESQLHLEKIESDLRSNHIRYWDCHYDSHCIEIPTRHSHNGKVIEREIKAIRKIMDSNGLTPKSNEDVCGGAHVHIGVPVAVQLFMFTDLISRYYLPWVFLEPDDTDSANNFQDIISSIVSVGEELEELAIYGYVDRQDGRPYLHNRDVGEALYYLLYEKNPLSKRSKTGNYSHGRSIRSMLLDDSKDHFVRIAEYRTIEFRFFEMPYTWEEQKLQLEFVAAYMDWIHRRMKRGEQLPVPKILTHNLMQKIPASKAVSDFNIMLRDIGLKPKDYEVFVKRNLYPRWKLGRHRT